MRILQLGKFYPVIGGVEKVMYDFTSGFAEYGIECDMLCANFDTSISEYKKIEFTKQNKIIVCPTISKMFATMLSPKMITYLRKNCNNYDIIHVHHPDPMAALSLFLSGYKGKVVVHWHSDILKQAHLLRFYRPLQNWLLKRAKCIVGTTPVYVKESPHLTKVQEKCTYLPIGIDPIVWNDEKVAKLKVQYNNKKIIFSLGRLVEYKGYKYLIDAAKYLDDDCVILIGGSGPLHDTLQQQIEQNNLDPKVKLLGRVSDEDLPNYYKAADIYCLSSIMKTEAFAIVQIESMSCGTPVVATKVPGSGVSWVNEHNVSGLNVEIKDSKALSEAIKQILSDEQLHTKLSIGAKQRFQKVFQRKEMIAKCLEIYSSLT